MTINELYQTIQKRKTNPSEKSYISSLFKQGEDRIIQKIGEEATEVVIAAKNKQKEQIIYETADLLFHLLIMLALYNINPNEILNELESRKKIPKTV